MKSLDIFTLMCVVEPYEGAVWQNVSTTISHIIRAVADDKHTGRRTHRTQRKYTEARHDFEDADFGNGDEVRIKTAAEV